MGIHLTIPFSFSHVLPIEMHFLSFRGWILGVSEDSTVEVLARE